MELKDQIAAAAVVVAALGVVVAFFVGVINWLKYRHDIRARLEDALPHPASPFVDIVHTHTRSSFGSDKHALTVEISNRDDRPIAIKEICWYVKSFRTRWPLSYMATALPAQALQDHKIQTADLVTLQVDIKNIFQQLHGGSLELLDKLAAISTLDVGIILTTGEGIVRQTPRTFRAFLADELIRPSWLAALVKFYIRLCRRSKD